MPPAPVVRPTAAFNRASIRPTRCTTPRRVRDQVAPHSRHHASSVVAVGSLARVLRRLRVLKLLRIRRARLTRRMRRGLRTIVVPVSRTVRAVRRGRRLVVGNKSRDTAGANDGANGQGQRLRPGAYRTPWKT
jgi:hypothetical protein